MPKLRIERETAAAQEYRPPKGAKHSQKFDCCGSTPAPCALFVRTGAIVSRGEVMNVSDAIARRQCIRAFLPTPVSGTVVTEIIDLARRAPSGGNLQPWQVYVLAGAPLAEFKAMIAQKLCAG